MKKLFKIVILFALFVTALLIFLPKENLYFLLEKELVKQEIILSDEQLETKLAGIDVLNGVVNFRNDDVALVKKIDINSYLVSSQISLEDIAVAGYLKQFIPSKIKTASLKHNVISPLEIAIDIDGEFGKFNGKVLLKENKISGELHPSELLKSKYQNVLYQFKFVDGRYLYEFKY